MRSIKFFILFIVMAACFTSAGYANVYDTEEELQEALEIYDTMTSGLDIITSCCDTKEQKNLYYTFWEYYISSQFLDYESNCVAGLTWFYDDLEDKYYLYPYIEVLWIPYDCIMANNGDMDKIGGYYYYAPYEQSYPTGRAMFYTLNYQYNSSSDSYVPNVTNFEFNLTEHNTSDGFIIWYNTDEHLMWYGGTVVLRNQENIVLSPKTFFYEYQILEVQQELIYEDKNTYVDYLNDGILRNAFDYVDICLVYNDDSSNVIRFYYDDEDLPRTYDITQYTSGLRFVDYSDFYKDDHLIAYADNDVFYEPEWKPDEEGYERYQELINPVIPIIPPDDLNSDFSDLLSAYTPYISSIAGNYTSIGCLYKGDDITKLLSKYNLKYCLTSTRFFDTYGTILSSDVPNLQEINNVDFIVLTSWTDYISLFDTEQKRNNMSNNFLSWKTVPETNLGWITDFNTPLYVISKSTSYTSSAGSVPIECMIYFTESFRTKLNTMILLDGISVFRDYLVTNNAALGQTSEKIVNGLASVYLNIDTLGGKIDKTNLHLVDIKELLVNIKTGIDNVLDEMRSESERELPEHGIFTPWLNFIKRIIGTYTPGAFINEFENYELPEDLLPEVSPAVEDPEEGFPDVAFQIPIREGPYYA